MSALIFGSFAYDTIMGETRRVSEGPVNLRCRVERPSAGTRAGTDCAKKEKELT